jgi:hypothetical protein
MTLLCLGLAGLFADPPQDPQPDTPAQRPVLPKVPPLQGIPKLKPKPLTEFQNPLLSPKPDVPAERPPLPAVPPSPPIPPMSTIKPNPEFFRQPMVPFIFNGETYYKMLLSRQKPAPEISPAASPAQPGRAARE